MKRGGKNTDDCPDMNIEWIPDIKWYTGCEWFCTEK